MIMMIHLQIIYNMNKFLYISCILLKIIACFLKLLDGFNSWIRRASSIKRCISPLEVELKMLTFSSVKSSTQDVP